MWWLILLIAGLTLLLISQKILAGRDDRNFPPLRSDGWLPWLGCAFEMSKEPLKFINTTRKEVSEPLSAAFNYVEYFDWSNNAIIVT